MTLGERAPQPDSAPPTGSPLPVAAVTASGHDGNVPANTLDDDPSTLGPETYDLPDTSARYVRVVGYGNTGNDWAGITETDIHPPA